MTGKRYSNTTAWRNLRRTVLAEEPVCHWCRKAPSTQVDHLIEVDRAPDLALERSNVVGSCRACNARRGQAYAQQKQADSKGTARPHAPQTRPARARAAAGVARTAPAEAFQVGAPTTLPRVSPSPLPEGENGPDTALIGRETPRLRTIVPDGVDSFADEVAELARTVAHVDLFPWQRRLFHDLLARRDGAPLWSSALISTGRQNGKSLCLALLVAWWALREAPRRGTPQNVIITSSKLELAMSVFRTVGDWLEPLGATVRRGNNSPAITMPDGSRIVAVAAVPDQHGRTADLIVLDEIWSIDPEVYYGALLPAQRTRKNSLIAAWSTAGDESSSLMIDLRNRGIKGIETGDPGKMYFAEWSPPPGSPPEERRWWGWGNPSLGHLIDPDELEVEASMNWQNFVRTGLNTWITAVDSWLPLGAWERQTEDGLLPTGRRVIAVEKAAEESRWVGLIAAKDDDGVHVRVAFITTSEVVMRRELERIMTDRAVELLIPPGVDLRLPPEIRRRSKHVGVKEIRLFTSQVHAMILGGEVWHDGDQALAEHVNRAVARTIEGSWYVVAQRSPGPVELCKCLIWAAAEISRHASAGRAAFATSDPVR